MNVNLQERRYIGQCVDLGSKAIKVETEVAGD